MCPTRLTQVSSRTTRLILVLTAAVVLLCAGCKYDNLVPPDHTESETVGGDEVPVGTPEGPPPGEAPNEAEAPNEDGDGEPPLVPEVKVSAPPDAEVDGEGPEEPPTDSEPLPTEPETTEPPLTESP